MVKIVKQRASSLRLPVATFKVVDFLHLVHVGALSRQMGVHHDVKVRAESLSSIIFDEFRANPSRHTIAKFLRRYRRRNPKAIRVVLRYLRESQIKNTPKTPTRLEALTLPDTRSEAYVQLRAEEEGEYMAESVLQQALREMDAERAAKNGGKAKS